MVRYRQSTIGTVREAENRHSPGIGTEDHPLETETDTAFGTDIHIRTRRIKDRRLVLDAEVIRHYLHHCTWGPKAAIEIEIIRCPFGAGTT